MTNSIDITPVETAATSLIRGYDLGGFRVGLNDHQQGSVILIADQNIPWQSPALDTLEISDLQPVIDRAADIDILVFGCGAEFTMPSRSLKEGLREHGIVLEWMDTGAACRTYNVLVTEARQVAAALIAIE